MPRPLDPVSLQLFIAVCEERSIARAAEREALVASALSKRIASLEAEVGVALLTRRRQGIEPTPAGEALLARAREVLAGLDQLRVELGAFGAGVQGSVRVLASPSVLAERLPEDIAAFMAEHPGIQVTLDERTSPDIVRGVREGTADLGVLWDLIDLAGVQVLPYRTDRLCVALSPDHPLARRPSLTFSDTLDHPSIGVSPGGQLDQLLRRHAALLGRLPSHRMQVSSLDAASRMIAAGLGLAILPLEAATPHAGAGLLALVPLAEPWAVRRLVVVTRPAPLLSAAARLLAEALRERAD
ncbi:LysR family transcriptional regulator [Piscinibacter sp. XHJ-5]|uniref:LysR family transcriptional regulator n=1 Tax=Piscinibacter sp. XHJ-5 TaxID=3037797 RepID=UPI0024534212|nr:LysR family transcriptional regulator [Piscinibacter sp. XHJ-5]